MKRLALCLALLFSSGCMMADDYGMEETVWYDAPHDACGCQVAGPAAPTRIAPTPQVVPLGGGVMPAGGVMPPPPAPQTREPELLRR